jgi:hypothetical protein
VFWFDYPVEECGEKINNASKKWCVYNSNIMKCFYLIYINLFFIVLVTGDQEESEKNGTEYAYKGFI